MPAKKPLSRVKAAAVRAAARRRADNRRRQREKRPEPPFRRSTQARVKPEEVEFRPMLQTHLQGVLRIGWHVFHEGKRAGRVAIVCHEKAGLPPGPTIDVQLNKNSQGRGLGTVVFRRAAELSKRPKILAVIARKNIASRLAAERAGYSQITDGANKDLVLVWRQPDPKSLRGRGFQQTEVASPLQITWPRCAAANSGTAMSQLFDLFPDHDPQLRRENRSGWTFGFDWPAHLLAYTDPKLADSAHRNYGLELRDLAGYMEVRRCGRADFVFSMFHSRALLAPSLAMARTGRSMRSVIHVDAHTDRQAPLLSKGGTGTLVNEAFSRHCCLDQPESVTKVIDAGLVHKGSFLAAYMLAVPEGELFHCWEEAKLCSCRLAHASGEVIIGGRRIAHDYLVSSSASGPEMWQCHTGVALPDSMANPTGEQGNGVWLDVDLDAFCNRFDGDSDRQKQQGSMRELKELRTRVQTFLRQLRAAAWRTRIEAISVAASPGFFPSEYWEEVIPAVCDGIEDALISI